MKKIIKVAEKVMLTAIVLALLIIAVAALLFAPVIIVVKAEAEEFTVSDYGIGEFAVKGDIERQAEEMIKGWGNKKPAEIIVQGFADKMGKIAENDSIARDRAEQMMFFLESETDVSRIVSVSKGDSENARKVVVTVEFVAAPPTLVPAVKPRLRSVYLLMSILVAWFLITVFLFRRADNKKPVEPEPGVKTEWIEVGGYSVRITSAGGLWYSPFSNLGGPFITKWRRTELQSSIKRCLVNPRFSEQIKILQEKGWIKPL